MIGPMRSVAAVTLLLGLAAPTAVSSAQGLGDVAAREAARRQHVAGGRKYTNEDLSASVAPAPATVATTAPAAAAAAPEEPSKGEAGADAKEPAPGSKEAFALATTKLNAERRPESYWRGRASTIRTAVDQADKKVADLRMRLATLEDQIRAGGGASYVQERDLTLRTLQTAQDDARTVQAEWDRLAGRAKGEKVPEEWLR